MEDNNKKGKNRRTYEKPRLRTIELAAEEVLAVGCKTQGSTAFALPVCHARPCASKGS